MGGKRQSRSTQGAGADATLPTVTAAPAPVSSNEPEPDLFQREALKAELVKQYKRAKEEAEDDTNGDRARASFATLAKHLLQEIRSIADEERAEAEDEELLAAAERLEKALANGAARAGGEQDPPFSAPETPAPH